jgi:uncharacterized protein (DUF1684 family)
MQCDQTQIEEGARRSSHNAADRLSLAEWRRRVGEMYAAARAAAEADQPAALARFRAERDQLFEYHVQSPLDPAQRVSFTGLAYYAYQASWRVVGRIDPDVPRQTFHIELPADGDFYYTRIGQVHFTVQGVEAQLSLFWVEGYGGGLFLPFKDQTNGQSSYGGGRYLYDTIKGADLGAYPDRIILDFNYAYNPSCAYSPQWVCPLSPPENSLAFAVEAGELAFE